MIADSRNLCPFESQGAKSCTLFPKEKAGGPCEAVRLSSPWGALS